MKRSIVVVLTFALLMMLATLASVSAVPQKWIPVTVTRTDLSLGFPTEMWITEGNTLHGRGGTGGFTTFNIAGEGVDLNGYSQSTYDFNINLNNGRGVFHWVITLIFPDGTFEGSVQVDGTYVLVNIWKSQDTIFLGNSFCNRDFDCVSAFHLHQQALRLNS